MYSSCPDADQMSVWVKWSVPIFSILIQVSLGINTMENIGTDDLTHTDIWSASGHEEYMRADQMSVWVKWSVPIFSILIQVSLGINTMAPTCATCTLSPSITFPVPL